MTKHICIVRAWFKIVSDDPKNVSRETNNQLLDVEIDNLEDREIMKNAIITRIKELRRTEGATESETNQLTIEVDNFNVISSIPLKDK